MIKLFNLLKINFLGITPFLLSINILHAVTFDVINEGMPDTFEHYKNFRLRVAEASENDFKKPQTEIEEALRKSADKIGIPSQGKQSEPTKVYHSNEKLQTSYLSFLLSADEIKKGVPTTLNCWTGNFINMEKKPLLTGTTHFTIHITGFTRKQIGKNMRPSLNYYITKQDAQKTSNKIYCLDDQDLLNRSTLKLLQYEPTFFNDSDNSFSNPEKEEN